MGQIGFLSKTIDSIPLAPMAEVPRQKLVLGEGLFYDLDCRKTQLNNNIMVVGASGTGKTRSYVIPNILEKQGSYIITDPKGNLYKKLHRELERDGYETLLIDFTNPGMSEKYNFFHYIKSPADIIRIAHSLVYIDKNGSRSLDPFWDEATQLYVQALIAYIVETCEPGTRNLDSLLTLSNAMEMPDSDDVYENNTLDVLFSRLEEENPRSFAVDQYKRFRIAASKTLRSILITFNSKIGMFATPEILKMTSANSFFFPQLGIQKTAVFVVVSDTDRSMDVLVNMFFTQAMQELCRFADLKCRDQALPVPVRFIMDDFATNCVIDEFPRMISSIRSRNISAMVMIQAESQLKKYYDEDAGTIISNCDTYVYLGGNDIETAEHVSTRANVSLQEILYMEKGSNWIFRRGEQPVNGKNYIPSFLNERNEGYRQVC